MKIIKQLLLLFIILPSALFAQTSNIKNFEKKYALKNFIKDYNYVLTNNKNIDNSFSILQNGCSIELNNNIKPILMKTVKKDLEFTFLHEISHCVLGKEVFYQPIDWKIDITIKEVEKIEKIIKENEDFYLKNKKTPLIKVIYHEVFADTLATMLYLKNNKNAENDILVLLKNRVVQNKNPYDSHLSANAIKYILFKKNEIKNLTIEKFKDKAIKITQEQILQYIRVEYE